ncbi:MAG: hypothetical protein EOO71_25125 [Myxococcaceae bacterium]|nr:MAG: hypothetical protein EOO71_25125 [Myxococcaceae bacterium]
MFENDDRFLAQFPHGSPERQYYSTLLKVVRSVSFPVSKEAGFALLRFLDKDWVEVGEVNTLTHPVAGSVKGDAELVGHVFSVINDDPFYWYSWYLEMTWEDFDEKLIRMWVEGFSRHGKVEGPLGI